jgi:hypothetical protein
MANFSVGGFEFQESASGALSISFPGASNGGRFNPPLTQAWIDGLKSTPAAENNPAFLAALNNLNPDAVNNTQGKNIHGNCRRIKFSNKCNKPKDCCRTLWGQH